LLDEFLGLARPVSFELVPLDAGRLLEELALAQEPVAREAGIELSISVEPDLPKARGDDAKLKQALMNLVVNAVDAMRERGHGTVRLLARKAGDDVELSVEDDGPGLPDHEAHELFRAFFTTKERGTGLGLSIVKQIVEQHGGSIDLRAREDGGTVASLRIPRAA